MQVLGSGAVRDELRIEAFAFVGDFHKKLLRIEPTNDMHFFAVIGPVAMPDGVGKAFFQRQADAEDFVFGPMALFQRPLQLLKYGASCPMSAGQLDFSCPSPLNVVDHR